MIDLRHIGGCTMFQRRHYEFIADVLAELQREADRRVDAETEADECRMHRTGGAADQAALTIGAFVRAFERSQPGFKADRFLARAAPAAIDWITRRRPASLQPEIDAAEAEALGRRDFRGDVPILDNPFPFGDPRRRHWVEGWRADWQASQPAP